jgi:hypothetical protein
MHTPVEAIDAEDLDALAELLGTFAGRVAVEDSFAVVVYVDERRQDPPDGSPGANGFTGRRRVNRVAVRDPA